MQNIANTRHNLKSLSLLIQPEVAEQREEQVNCYHAHSQKMDLTSAEQNELFQKVLKFLEEFLSNKALFSKMFEQLSKNKSSIKVGSNKQQQRILSFKKMNMGSKVCFEGEVTKQETIQKKQEGKKTSRGNYKKISIFVLEQDFSSSQDFSEELITENSIKTIRSIQIPRMEMNLEAISLIYDTPQPFLINLSLCLFIRYCFLTKRKVKFEESAWVLCVATILAYKLYYDQQLQGLIDCFISVMKISRKDLLDLERCFFEQIDYNTIIYNYDYHFVLSTLLSMDIQNKQ